MQIVDIGGGDKQAESFNETHTFELNTSFEFFPSSTRNERKNNVTEPNSSFVFESKTHSEAKQIKSDLDRDLNNLVGNISQLSLKQHEMDQVFLQMEKLIKSYQNATCRLIENEKIQNTLETLNAVGSLISDKLRVLNSNFKRNKMYKGIVKWQ